MAITLWGAVPPSADMVVIDFVALTSWLLRLWTGEQDADTLAHPEVVVAVTVRHTVHVNTVNVAPRLADDDLTGMMVHEAAHVLQFYPPGVDTWLNEGLADYVRYYVIRPTDPGRGFDPARARFTDGYAPAAALLDWLERGRPGVAVNVNRVMHGGGDGAAWIEAATGRTVDQLWASYLASR